MNLPGNIQAQPTPELYQAAGGVSALQKQFEDGENFAFEDGELYEFES